MVSGSCSSDVGADEEREMSFSSAIVAIDRLWVEGL